MDLFIFLEKSGDYWADNSIEKRPNYGFHLDMRCLALACANCNIRCLNCQNHDTLHEAGTRLEITNLLIPKVNDDMDMIRQMCRWLVEHDMQDCPLHFSRFFPRYKMSNSYSTPKNTLIKARDIALDEVIKKVYLGNI